ncbi:outer membrane usher protein [Serratia sp. JSRIV001]|uniref:outer membrane usher protein n=1 Tax=Serratia sp. JSRIV001 TaxID=2831893 RepID=UPI001CBD7CED|nr:outer membrane usher protein [Serratia sp. JSRIV001]UAN45369.1 outer membrane usher protein [Serratia sp. JSRIV001]
MLLLYFKTLLSRPSILWIIISYIISGTVASAQTTGFQFNTDVLDINDRENIDLDRFSHSNYIMPGSYVMSIQVNKQQLLEQSVMFYAPEGDANSSEACVSPQLVELLGLKPEIKKWLTWRHKGQCLGVSSLEGMTARGDLGSATLYLSIPQAYLEFVSDDWDPPSRWDNGIPGILLDYNLNGQTQRQLKQGTQAYSINGNGTLGANLSSWRLRADWQTRFNRQLGSGQPAQNSWDWSRYYMYRAISSLSAKLTLGENFLHSDIFDGFRFAGASLVTDDSMLPPNLRGYAPEVTGVARTNAKVVISQQGRILQETQVAAGPFRIQDISNAVSGQLDIRIEEQDGRVQTFQMETANIPYLTRPGTVRYKLAAGRPSDWQHRTNGPIFATGEFSWGISNGWSLYGGGVVGGEYNSVAGGVGRDLMVLGALSFDVTQSRAKLPQSDRALAGSTYRLSYSKRFDDYDSQVTFAGYRFSQQNYMSMSEYLDARTQGIRSQNSKEMYTTTLNKQFRALDLSLYLDYSHQSYWDRPSSARYNLTLSRYFDIGRFKDLSLSMTAYRNKFNRANDDGMYFSLSMPWGNSGSVSYSSSLIRNDNTHQVGYFDRLNEHDSYQLSSGVSRSGATASAFYSHQGDITQINGNANYQAGRFASVGMSLQGGATVTLEGAALHRSSVIGGTRVLVDTDGVGGIPIRGYGATTGSNRFGKVVVADVSNYYRNRISIDLNTLPDNAEATRSVVQATLTEGAIGYRHFEVISGEKVMAIIRLADGATPPFGASVLNNKQQSVGIVSDGGSVYLSGIQPGEAMLVHWNGGPQCELSLPVALSNSQQTDMLLPCRLLRKRDKGT